MNREYEKLPVNLTSANFWKTCTGARKVEPQISEEDLQHIPSKSPLIVAAHPFGGLEAVVLDNLLK